MAQFILERTLPDGRVKRHDPLPRPMACNAAYFVLTDNRVVGMVAADKIAKELMSSPTGTEVGVGGYVFKLVEV